MKKMGAFTFGFLLIASKLLLELSTTQEQIVHFTNLVCTVIVMSFFFGILTTIVSSIMKFLVLLEKRDASPNDTELAAAISLVLVFFIFAYFPFPANITNLIAKIIS